MLRVCGMWTCNCFLTYTSICNRSVKIVTKRDLAKQYHSSSTVTLVSDVYTVL
jgi:hypothetical protein